MIFQIALLTLLLQVAEIKGHGRLLVPPARSSAWREDPVRFPTEFDDNGFNCGGLDTQYRLNRGKCGICGEAYDQPKKFEKGGSFYRGFPVRTYTQGQRIEAKIEITANHLGWFEFRICNADKLNGAEATQQCLNEYLLKDDMGKTRHSLESSKAGMFYVNLKLPDNLACDHCVFQWRYHSGNSWGFDVTTQRGCLGCGNQEEFYGCSDITINSINSNRREYEIQSSVPESTSYQVEKKEKAEESGNSNDEQVYISKRVLKRLLNELKRLKEEVNKREMEAVERRRLSEDNMMNYGDMVERELGDNTDSSYIPPTRHRNFVEMYYPDK